MDTETAEVDSPQITETADENVSLDDLRAALGHNEPEPQGEEQQPEADATEDQVPSEPGQPPPAEGQQPEAEGDRLAKRRIRPKNELDQQVIDLYRSDAFDGSFADATRVIYTQTGTDTNQSPQPQPAEATQPESDGYAEYVAGIQGQIQELEQKVATAADDLETTEALKFQREIMKRELELQTAQSRKERHDEAQDLNAYNAHRGRSMESRNKVFERFPVLQDKNSIHRKQFDDFIQHSSRNPDYATVFESPKWPELMANEFATRYNARQPAQTAPQAQPVMQAPPQVAPQMGTQAKVLTTGTAAQPVHTQPTAQGLLSDMPNISKDDLYSLLGNPGGPQPRV
jgi:hypothetical protein